MDPDVMDVDSRSTGGSPVPPPAGPKTPSTDRMAIDSPRTEKTTNGPLLNDHRLSRISSSQKPPDGSATKIRGFTAVNDPTARLLSAAAQRLTEKKPPTPPQTVSREPEVNEPPPKPAPVESVLEDGSVLVSQNAPAAVKFEIVLPGPPLDKDSYQEIFPDVVNRILAVSNDGDGNKFYDVVYNDGRHETVELDVLLEIENGKHALDKFPKSRPTNPLKRRHNVSNSDSSISTHRPNKVRIDSDDDDLNGDDLDDNPIATASHQQTIRRFLRPMSERSRQESVISQDSDVRPRRRNTRTKTTMRRSLGVNFMADTEDELSQISPPRNLRRRTTMPAQPVVSYVDAFMTSDDEEDDDFFLTRSSVTPATSAKRHHGRRGVSSVSKQSRRSGRQRTDSFEPSTESEEDLRRSTRATRNVQSMREADGMDYTSFQVAEERSQTPKAISIKESFKDAVSEDIPFVQKHMQICDSCNLSAGKDRGRLVYCQGCSLAYHRTCIGNRQAREHMVTKVGEGDFVLQCRFCIGRHHQKSNLAPEFGKCQACHVVGKSCVAFSKRKTPKQEEKLREQNGGVDPITPVDRALINNPENPLFRCSQCRRAWHGDHLPPHDDEEENGEESTLEKRWEEYAFDWKCSLCASQVDQVNALVAWRFVSDAEPNNNEAELPDKEATQTQPEVIPIYGEYSDDDKEYLVKWENKSYAHVTWMPGPWVFSMAASASRRAFARKSDEHELYKKTIEEAVPDEFLMVDIIFDVKYESGAPNARNFDQDFDRIDAISEIYFKPQGLPYTETVWDAPPDETNLDMYHSFVMAYQQFLCGKYFYQESSTRMWDRVAKFKRAPIDDIVLSDQPEVMKGKLMEYQLKGVNWLLRRYHSGHNAILADEMGLGKTVQVITLLTTLITEEPRVWPFLVVVPNSTCPNWRREIKQWSPDLRVVTYYGGKDAQNMAHKYELFPGGSSDMRAHIVVMSFDSAQDEETRRRFRGIRWAGLVVDEGQRLKNDKSILYSALNSMKFPFRLLLTGTPLQNNTRELFNLMQFIDPTFDAEKLDLQFSELNSEKIRELHQMINPYFLRRTKAGVLKFLPAMSQIIVPVSMTVVQEKLCKSIMAKNPQLIQAVFRKTAIAKNERGSLNNILMQLRMCLCHPFLYSSAIEERTDDPELARRNLVEASGKLILLEGLLTKLKEQGHRVLIFSQFLGQLDIMEVFLAGMGLQATRLDGSVSSLERQKRIDRFNQPNSPLFAFLLTTGAGGVGINLATADTVIILDPDFNPKRDIQALSRAHRIGQKNKVLCLQFMVKDSVEEKIMQMSKKKMALDHALIERMGATAKDGDDFEGVLRHGAEALFKDDYQRDIIRYDAAAIEKLLDRSFTKEDQEAGPDTQFSYGKVWSNEGGGTVTNSLGCETDNTSGAVTSLAWQKILAQREAEMLQEIASKQEILGRGGRVRRAVNYRMNQAAKFEKEDSDITTSEAGPDLDLYHDDGEANDDDEFQDYQSKDTQAVIDLTDEVNNISSVATANNTVIGPGAIAPVVAVARTPLPNNNKAPSMNPTSKSHNTLNGFLQTSLRPPRLSGNVQTATNPQALSTEMQTSLALPVIPNRPRGDGPYPQIPAQVLSTAVTNQMRDFVSRPTATTPAQNPMASPAVSNQNQTPASCLNLPNTVQPSASSSVAGNNRQMGVAPPNAPSQRTMPVNAPPAPITMQTYGPSSFMPTRFQGPVAPPVAPTRPETNVPGPVPATTVQPSVSSSSMPTPGQAVVQPPTISHAMQTSVSSRPALNTNKPSTSSPHLINLEQVPKHSAGMPNAVQAQPVVTPSSMPFPMKRSTSPPIMQSAEPNHIPPQVAMNPTPLARSQSMQPLPPAPHQRNSLGIVNQGDWAPQPIPNRSMYPQVGQEALNLPMQTQHNASPQPQVLSNTVPPSRHQSVQPDSLRRQLSSNSLSNSAQPRQMPSPTPHNMQYPSGQQVYYVNSNNMIIPVVTVGPPIPIEQARNMHSHSQSTLNMTHQRHPSGNRMLNAQQSQNMVQRPQNTVQRPQGMHQRPRDTSQRPQNLHQRPQNMYQDPQSMLQQAQHMAQQSQQMAQQFQQMAQQRRQMLQQSQRAQPPRAMYNQVPVQNNGAAVPRAQQFVSSHPTANSGPVPQGQALLQHRAQQSLRQTQSPQPQSAPGSPYQPPISSYLSHQMQPPTQMPHNPITTTPNAGTPMVTTPTTTVFPTTTPKAGTPMATTPTTTMFPTTASITATHTTPAPITATHTTPAPPAATHTTPAPNPAMPATPAPNPAMSATPAFTNATPASTTPATIPPQSLGMKELRFMLPKIFQLEEIPAIANLPPVDSEVPELLQPSSSSIRTAIEALKRLDLPDKVLRPSITVLDNTLQQVKRAEKEGKVIILRRKD
ncbi:uncharacterized protein BROUX77_006784 [Berkeleyomyces rouxiae]|uniref:uncharacterized protein n=1 Tax=Berkeleyomyces rouxiae TaxID=2035830 RepID=UPI003B75EE20